MRPAAAEPNSWKSVEGPKYCDASVHVEQAARAIVEAEAAAQRGLMLMQTPHDGNQEQQPPQAAGVSMLPLLGLHLQGSLVGTLLPIISACCRQELQLRPNRNEWLPPACVMQLHSLRELQITAGLLMTDISRSMVLEDTLRILSTFTQLTKLEATFLGRESFTHLPVSLIELSAACGVALDDEAPTAPTAQVNLGHLTRLTRLQTGAVHSSQMLPAQLRELDTYQLKWDVGFVQLQQLQSVSLTACETEPCLAPLTAMTQLTALQLQTVGIKPGMSEVCSHLPQLPLLRLHSSDNVYSAQDVECLGRCTQLTELQLDCARLGLSVGDFAQQLQRLHSLQVLRLDSARFTYNVRTPEDLEPLVVALKQLCGRRLTRLRLCDVTLSDEQESGLRGLLGRGFSYREGQMHTDSSFTEESRDYSSASDDEGSSNDGGEGGLEGAGVDSDGGHGSDGPAGDDAIVISDDE